MHKAHIENIKFQIQEIDKLLKHYAGLLDKNEIPDAVELAALAGVLHSFYNGLERIFIEYLKKENVMIPTGKNWHKSLIDCLFLPNEYGKLLLPLTYKEIITEYLSFRHFYRHSYSFYLNWEDMKHLSIELKSNWKNIKHYLNNK